jgi:hypothetical protein
LFRDAPFRKNPTRHRPSRIECRFANYSTVAPGSFSGSLPEPCYCGSEFCKCCLNSLTQAALHPEERAQPYDICKQLALLGFGARPRIG